MKKIILVLLFNLTLLTGCSHNQTLYSWDANYEPGVYNTLQGKNGDIGERIASMEEAIHQSVSDDQKLPPGFYAQLGLLYGKVGDEQKMFECFETEKTLFPESKQYMDFLLSKKHKNTDKKVA